MELQMQTDKSYAPLRTDLDELVNNYFSSMRVSEEQKRFIEMIFFAGASSAYGILVNTPEKQGTLFDEIMDHAEKFERQKVA
jgi:hypothetical protein